MNADPLPDPLAVTSASQWARLPVIERQPLLKRNPPRPCLGDHDVISGPVSPEALHVAQILPVVLRQSFLPHGSVEFVEAGDPQEAPDVCIAPLPTIYQRASALT